MRRSATAGYVLLRTGRDDGRMARIQHRMGRVDARRKQGGRVSVEITRQRRVDLQRGGIGRAEAGGRAVERGRMPGGSHRQHVRTDHRVRVLAGGKAVQRRPRQAHRLRVELVRQDATVRRRWRRQMVAVVAEKGRQAHLVRHRHWQATGRSIGVGVGRHDVAHVEAGMWRTVRQLTARAGRATGASASTVEGVGAFVAGGSILDRLLLALGQIDQAGLLLQQVLGQLLVVPVALVLEHLHLVRTAQLIASRAVVWHCCTIIRGLTATTIESLINYKRFLSTVRSHTRTLIYAITILYSKM